MREGVHSINRIFIGLGTLFGISLILVAINLKDWAFEKPFVYFLAFGSPLFIGWGFCLTKKVDIGVNSPWAILCLFTSGFLGFPILYFSGLAIQTTQSISLFGYVFISMIFIVVAIGWLRLFNLSPKQLHAQSETKTIFLVGFAIAICILLLSMYKVVGI
jgi:hypothetical protein